MPTPNNTLSLSINGHKHDDWQSYEIDSDLLIAADAWLVDIATPNTLPQYIEVGASVKVKLDDAVILTGIIDDINESAAKGQHTISLSGRDLAGQLLDCSAPIFDGQELSLSQILSEFLTPFNIPYKIEAASTSIRQKVTVDVGETVWEAISKAAEANGLWQWFTPDGVLVIGEPNPKTAIVAHLIMRRDGIGNNVESIIRHRGLNDRYSSITVLSQSSQTQPTFYQDMEGTAENEADNAQPNIKATLNDNGLGIYRPKIVMAGDCENIAATRAKAQKMMVDGQLNSHTITAIVKGHYSETGILWQPRQRVTLLSEPHGIDGIFFVMGRKFKLSRTSGIVTELRLKQDGIWQIDPFKAKAKKRKGKKSAPFEDIVIPPLLKKPS